MKLRKSLKTPQQTEREKKNTDIQQTAKNCTPNEEESY